MKQVRIGVVVLAAMFAFPSPAGADDAQLWATYTADNPDVNRVGPQFERALKRFERNPRRYYRSVVRTGLELDKIAAGIATQFEAVQPSTSTGAKIKELILLTLRDARRGYRLTAAAARNVARGRRVGLRQARRADQAFARTFRYDRRVVRAFKALGFSR
jgi:hypothetical protein